MGVIKEHLCVDRTWQPGASAACDLHERQSAGRRSMRSPVLREENRLGVTQNEVRAHMEQMQRSGRIHPGGDKSVMRRGEMMKSTSGTIVGGRG